MISKCVMHSFVVKTDTSWQHNDKIDNDKIVALDDDTNESDEQKCRVSDSNVTKVKLAWKANNTTMQR